MRRLRIVNISLSIVLTLIFLTFGLTVFSISYLRLFESFGDLFNSIKLYFEGLFTGFYTPPVKVLEKSDVLKWNAILPDDVERFKFNFKVFFKVLFSLENLKYFFVVLGNKIEKGARVITIVLPLIVLLFFLMKMLYYRPNTNHNKDTFSLRIYKWIMRKTIYPLKRFLRQYREYLSEYSHIWKLWVLGWVIQLNLGSIIVELFAFIFYFILTYDVKSIYGQVVKLSVDLQVFFKYAPLWTLPIIIYYFFDKWRKRVAISRLRHFEARNCGFINSLPISTMGCGSMGKKKTTLITDMALSQEVMFRQKALEIMQKADIKFPKFPWIQLENELNLCMEFGSVYNLATVKDWVKKKEQRFNRHNDVNLQLYGYDMFNYGREFSDGLYVKDLFEIIKTYAQAYFIYVITSSLIVSNYSIRSDNKMISQGNLPLWLTDFFGETKRVGRYSHIIDFDALRLGRKVIENNPKSGSFEFGVAVITEIGKERGNMLELKEVKKGVDETNQKNDLFNAWLKMCRHNATVDNFPFIKVLVDEQRPESWGADARELCDVLYVVDSTELKLSIPCYTIEEMISEWAYNKFFDFYTDMRFKRGDNTLLVHILKGITAWLFKRNLRVINKYGYSQLEIEKQKGTLDGQVVYKKYYLMNQKIYNKRFTTDCFSDYFNELARECNLGLNDYENYEGIKATVEELKMQNSYFINSLYK